MRKSKMDQRSSTNFQWRAGEDKAVMRLDGFDGLRVLGLAILMCWASSRITVSNSISAYLSASPDERVAGMTRSLSAMRGKSS